MDSTETNKHLVSQLSREYEDMSKFRFGEVIRLPTAAESLCRFQTKPIHEKTLGDSDYAQYNLFAYANDQNNNIKSSNNFEFTTAQPLNTSTKENSSFQYAANNMNDSINVTPSHSYTQEPNEQQQNQADINSIYLQTYLTNFANLPYDAAQVLLKFSQPNQLSPVSSSSSTLSPTNTQNLSSYLSNQNNVQSNNLSHYYLNQFGIDPSNYQSLNINALRNENFPFQNLTGINNDDDTKSNLSQSNKRPKSTFPFGKCKVCCDKATGVHYGIATCEGCKGFFKRSTLRKEKYRCFFGSNCPLTPENRNRCKACRFRKCMEVGMSIQGVKMGRIPKAEKEKAIMGLKFKSDKEMQNTTEDNFDCDDSSSDSILFENSNESTSLGNSQTNNHSEITTVSNVNTSPSESNGDKPLTEKKTQGDNSNNLTKSFKNVSGIIENNLQLIVDKTKMVNLNDLNRQKLTSSCHSQINKKKESESDKVQTVSTTNASFQACSLKEVSDLNKDNNQKDQSKSTQLDLAENPLDMRLKVGSEKDSQSNQVYDYLHINNELLNDIFSENASLSELHNRNNKLALCNSQVTTDLDYNQYLMVSLLSEKMHKVYIEQSEFDKSNRDRARNFANLGVKVFDGHDAQISDVWHGLLESIPHFINRLIAHAKEIPGLNEFNPNDFMLIINSRVFDFFLIANSALFINGESYMMLGNKIQYTRAWMNKVIGIEMTNAIFEFEEEFNSLQMTQKEIALLYPLVFTKYNKNFQDPQRIRYLNQIYLKALLYEFDLNRRSPSFVKKWQNVMLKLPQMNKLQNEKIGSLTPAC